MNSKKFPIGHEPRNNPKLSNSPHARAHHAPAVDRDAEPTFRTHPDERVTRRPVSQLSQQVCELMTRDVVAVDKNERLDHVLQIMEKCNITKLPVTDGLRYLGVISDAEIADALGSLHNAGKRASTLHASSVMLRNAPTTQPDAKVMDVVKLAKTGGFSILPVLDDKMVVGVLTKADLLPLVMDARRVSAIMRTRVRVVAPSDRVIHARRVMLDDKVERLPVLDDGKLVGLVSEMEIALGLDRFKNRFPEVHQHAQLESFLVQDVMRNTVVSAKPDTPIIDAARLMHDRQIGGLPITTDETGKIVGMVTRTDLIRTIDTVGGG